MHTPPRPDPNDDAIDLGEFGRAIVRHWRKIAVIGAALFALAVLFVLFARPQFSVIGSMFLGQAQTGAPPQVPSNLSFLANFQSVSDVDTQIELLDSQALVEQAILQSGINSPVMPMGSPIVRYWRWRLLQHGQVAAFGPQPGAVTARFASFADTVGGTVTYEIIIGAGNHYRIITPADWFTKAALVLRGTLGEPAAGGGLRLLLQAAIPSAPPQAGQRFILKVTPPQLLAYGLIAKNLTVVAGGTVTQPSQIATVRFDWFDPYGGKLFTERLMQDFIATQLRWSTDSASSTETFVAQQLAKVRAALKESDKALAAYQSHTSLLDVPENAKAVIDQLSSYEVQRTTIELQQRALKQLAAAIADPEPPLNPFLISQTNDPALGQLAVQLATDQAAMMSLHVQFGAYAPQVLGERATIDKLEDSIKSLVNNDVASASTSLASIDSSIASFKSDIKKMPSASLKVVALERSSNVYGQLYVLLMQDEEDAEVSKAATISNTRVVSPAELPAGPSWPKAKLTLVIALVLAPFFGVVLVLVQRALSGRYQSDGEIRRSIGLPVFGQVPYRPRRDLLVGVLANDPRSTFAEAFRVLRGKVYQAMYEQTPHVVAVIATARGDGTTMVAANLAKALADDGKSVVLVDADLHGGAMHAPLRQEPARGLAEWLADPARPMLRKLPQQKFDFLAAGKPPADPSALLNEQNLARVVGALRGDYDFVILGCPPLPLLSDGMALGRQSDIILSVVTVERTPRGVFAVHRESLAALARTQGIVINGIDPALLVDPSSGVTGFDALRSRLKRRGVRRAVRVSG